MIKKILEIIELLLIIFFFLAIFITMPFMLEAIEEDTAASINYVLIILFFFYVIYKTSKSGQDKIRNIKTKRTGGKKN